jgi:hypothetical protein
MKTITNEIMNEASKAHALDQLGENQFYANPDAVKSITDDYKAGFLVAIKLVEEQGEVVNLIQL